MARIFSSKTWEWLQAVLLAVNLIWTTLRLGGFRAETMVVTSALTGALLLVHAASLLALRGSPSASESVPLSVAPRVHPAGWPFLPFLVFAAINVQWITPVRWLGWIDWFGWAQAVAVFWIVLNGIRSRAARWMVAATLVALGLAAVLLGCYQRFVQPDWLMLHRTQADQYLERASGCFGIPNSMAAFLLLLLPPVAALALRRGASAVARVFFGWLALVFIFGIGLTISRGAWLGLALALTAWPLFGARGRWWRRLRLAAAIFLAAIAVGALTYSASPRVRERLTQLRTIPVSGAVPFFGGWLGSSIGNIRWWGPGRAVLTVSSSAFARKDF